MTALVIRPKWEPWFPGAMYCARLVDRGASPELAGVCWLIHLCDNALKGVADG